MWEIGGLVVALISVVFLVVLKKGKIPGLENKKKLNKPEPVHRTKAFLKSIKQ